MKWYQYSIKSFSPSLIISLQLAGPIISIFTSESDPLPLPSKFLVVHLSHPPSQAYPPEHVLTPVLLLIATVYSHRLIDVLFSGGGEKKLWGSGTSCVVAAPWTRRTTVLSYSPIGTLPLKPDVGRNSFKISFKYVISIRDDKSYSKWLFLFLPFPVPEGRSKEMVVYYV